MDYAEIKREADCISIKPRGWLPKPIWREINDILFLKVSEGNTGDNGTR
jgi:hypothetical protein